MFGGCEGFRCLEVVRNIDVQEFSAIARLIISGGVMLGGRGRVSSI